MSVSSDEIPSPTANLSSALIDFTGCVGNAVPDICSFSLTIGEAYVPFAPGEDDECEDDDEACSQVWVRVMSVAMKDEPGTQGWDESPATVGYTLVADIEVGVLRCFGITEEGEAPSADEVLTAAIQSMEDMHAIFAAAMNCEVWEAINAGEWSPSGPLGGQYGGIWTFTVELPTECVVSGNESF